MLLRTGVSFLNHLLMAEPWASARLKPFAGQRARAEFGQLSLTVVILGDGSLAPCENASGSPSAVLIQLPEDTPRRLLADRSSLLANARITGAADFAEALGFVARNLRWDVEADLARIVGDIPARRIALASRNSTAALKSQVQRLGENISEFIADELTLLLRESDFKEFSAGVGAASADLDRLEQRISRL